MHPLLEYVVIEKLKKDQTGGVLMPDDDELQPAKVVAIGTKKFPKDGIVIEKDFPEGIIVYYKSNSNLIKIPENGEQKELYLISMFDLLYAQTK